MTTNKEEKELYTIQEAATLLGITTKTVREWDKEGKIKSTRTEGNHRRIAKSEIDRLTKKEPEKKMSQLEHTLNILEDYLNPIVKYNKLSTEYKVCNCRFQIEYYDYHVKSYPFIAKINTDLSKRPFDDSDHIIKRFTPEDFKDDLDSFRLKVENEIKCIKRLIKESNNDFNMIYSIHASYQPIDLHDFEKITIHDDKYFDHGKEYVRISIFTKYGDSVDYVTDQESLTDLINRIYFKQSGE